ncbi:MAG: aspartate kinase [Promethearchaeota archaeon]|nr:MAG: aspartate kinase [Candidatus Lokiarchaeota archaeon]
MTIEVQIMKIGGSCLSNARSFDRILKIIEETPTSIVLVFSAFNSITDLLIQTIEYACEGNSQPLNAKLKEIQDFHNDIITALFSDYPKVYNEMRLMLQEVIGKLVYLLEELKEFGWSPYFKDSIISFGEKLSNAIISRFLNLHQIDHILYHGEDLIITNDHFGDAIANLQYTQKRIERDLIPRLVNNHYKRVFCVEGFIGRSVSGLTTTLGRGGTDYTAAVIARALAVSGKFSSISLTLWKDVAGIYSADPKFVQHARYLNSISYAMAKELSFFGAKILHPKCISIIESFNIPVYIKKFPDNDQTEGIETPFKKEDHGTLISSQDGDKNIYSISIIQEAYIVTVSSETFVNAPGILGEIFSKLGEEEISVNVVTQSSSEINTSFIISKTDGPEAIKILKSNPNFEEWFKIKMELVGVVAIIGRDIANSKNQMKIYQALSKMGINPIAVAQASDALNISIVVPKNDVKPAANAINEVFFKPMSVKK